MQRIAKLRLAYAAVTILIIAAEVFIALYVRDSFVRPYLGDVLAVIAVYTFVRIFLPERPQALPVYVFLFAVGAELLQGMDLLSFLDLPRGSFLGILLGSVFDFKDILCYAAGCALLAVYEIIIFARKR